MNDDFSDKLLLSLSVSSFFSLTLFFFGPVNLYLTNILEFSCSFSTILYFFLTLSILSAAFLTALLVSLKFSFNNRAVSLVFTLALLLWLQGNLLVWNYGPLDGREIDWKTYRTYGFIDGPIWVVLLLLAFWASPYMTRIGRKASIFFILIQLLSTGVYAVKAPDATYLHKDFAADEKAIFHFSPEKNVIILVLDAFQGDVFQDIINESPRYKDIFDGFTYFRNALGGYPVTYASVPLILTGRYYDNSVPVKEFLRDAFTSNSIPKLLKDNGYQVDIIGGERKTLFCDETNVSNYAGITQLVEHEVKYKDAAFLLDLTFFRFLPHFAKRYIYNDQTWLFRNFSWNKTFGKSPSGKQWDSVRMIRKMAEQANAASQQYTFKYIHLPLPHFPMRINERLEYEEMEDSRPNFKKQAKGTLELTNVFLDTLKRMGIYDDTMIFVIADHGIGQKIDPGVFGYTEKIDSPSPIMDRIKASALPLFLVKPFGSRGALKVSNAPVSLSDVAKTAIGQLGVEAELPGMSVFEISESDKRDRRFLFHELEFDAKKEYYLWPMKEYVVSGFPWANESWHSTHRLFTSEGVKSYSSSPVENAFNIDFGVNGNYRQYAGKGWSSPDEGFTWTDGKRASIIIPMAKTDANIKLRARLMPFLVPGRLEKQAVKAYVNEELLATWTCSADPEKTEEKRDFQEYEALIPKHYLRGDSTIMMAFELPDAASPASLGMNEDTRALGIAMKTIRLSETDEMPGTAIYKWGTPIDFSGGGNYLCFQGPGWSDHYKDDFTWTSGRTSSLIIPIRNTSANVELKAVFRPLTVPGKLEGQLVKVFVNDTFVGEWVAGRHSKIWDRIMRNRGFEEHTILIPNNLLTNDPMKITFDLPNAAAPKELGLNWDTRVLGIAMRSVVLKESLQ